MTSTIRPAIAATIMAAAFAAPFASAREAADFFVDAPPAVAGIVDKHARLDMLDYFRSGLDTPSANTLQGHSSIVLLEPERLRIEISDNTMVEMALVPLKSDTIIAVIETVATPARDSGIRFYRTDWSEIPAPAMPGAIDFIAKSDRKKAAGTAMPEFIFTSAEYDPATHRFRFTDNTAEYYTASDAPEGLKLMRPVIEMTFNGKKFVEAK